MLGPPKTSFASSRNITKLDERDQEQESPAANQRSRFFRDRENNKTGNSRDWRSSKAQDDDDALTSDAKFTPRQPRESNGFGQRLDQRWSRGDNDRDRERERDRDRERDRPAQRGGWREREKMRNERQDAPEKEPEWMDEPVEKENKNLMRTQQDFERWKEGMKAKQAPSADTKEEVLPEEVVTPVKSTPAHSKPQTPLVADAPGFDKLFGSWGETKRIESPVETRTTKTPALGKGKSSRFASMFAPKEETRPVPEEIEPALTGSNEDKEGFARILAMLGNTSRSGVASPAKEQNGRGPPPGPPPGFGPPPSTQDALAAMFDKAPKSTQSPRPQSNFGPDSFMPPPPPQFSRPSSNVASPNPAAMRNDHGAAQLPQHMQSIFLEQTPRNGPTPDSFNAQNSRKPNSLNKDSEFLLNLIQAKNANRGPPPPRPQNEPDNFQLFLDQPPKMQTAAPKPRLPRPTESIEEQLFPGGQHPQLIDHGRPRAPPGFIEDPSIVVQQAQRSYPNGPPQQRRQSSAQQGPNAGPGAPQDFPPNFQFMTGPPPPGSGERMPPPPPGFNPNTRQPPGFANFPNMFQQPNAQLPPQQGPGLQGPPPGFPPGMPPPPGFGAQGPPPPGFFGGPNHGLGAPPGFGPPGMMMMPGGGVRSPEGTPGMRSPQEGPGMGMPMLQGMGAGFNRR